MHTLRVLALACLTLAGSVVRADEKPGMDIGFVRLKGISIEEVRTVAEPLLSTAGKLTYIDSRALLVIRDYPEQIELIKKVINEIDVHPANVRVEVIFDEQKDAGREELGLDAAGLRITHAGGKTRAAGSVRISAGSTSTSSSDFTNQYVVAGNNRPAQIWVGKTVPDVAWVHEYGFRHGWWRQELVWQDVGASLWVLPRLLPDGVIEVEVYPRLTAKGKEPLSMDIKQLSTKIVVQDGQIMPLGGLDQETCLVYSKLLGQGKVFNGSRLAISLRATVMPMPKRVEEDLKRGPGDPPPPLQPPARRPPLHTR